MAHAAKTTTATISYLENGKKRTNAETLERVADALGMTLAWSLQDAAQDPAAPPGAQPAPPPAPKPEAHEHAPPGVEARLEALEEQARRQTDLLQQTNLLLAQILARGSGRTTSGRRGNGDDPQVGTVA